MVHDDDDVGHAECFFLIVGNKDEGNAQLFFNLDELELHTAAQLPVQGTERFIKKQYPRLIDDGPSNGYALLLAAGEVDDVGVFIAVEVNEFQGIADLIADVVAGLAVNLGPESDVLGDIHVRKKGIILEHRIDLTPIGWQLGNILPIKDDSPFIGCFKTGKEPQSRRLATAARS